MTDVWNDPPVESAYEDRQTASPPRPARDYDDDDQDAPGLSLFVSGLDPSVTDDVLKVTFGEHGTVDNINIMREPHTKISRGFGFVTFTEPNSAAVAMEALQGAPIEGKPIKIELAKRSKPRTPTPG
ncbi:putative transformer-SR ribonucleoprotein, partial [Lipomyces arxii]|uniref:putative transformer-SR ribonucleoprotein n=1 Tax=Lipomyces arxii TaxID=56418 RepID=UPI0034CE844A